jgi:hypothetical protein
MHLVWKIQRPVDVAFYSTYTGSANRSVCEKIAKNVAQPIIAKNFNCGKKVAQK